MTTISKFDIHVFGDGNGETIFLEFQNNRVAVIDFGYKYFLNWFDTYLQDKQIKNIDFIMWTHPHDDHTHYFSDFLDYIKNKKMTINNYYRFPYARFKKVSEIIDLTKEQLSDIINYSSFCYVKSTTPKTMLSLCEKLSDFIKQKIIINHDLISVGKELFPKNIIQENISIHCIAPTEKDIEEYQEYVDRILKRQDPVENLSISSEKHNKISTAICIKFGNLNIILGGDVENPTWKNVLDNENYHIYTKSKISFLKAPHHGSSNAFSKDIWQSWGKDYTIAITQFQKCGLPKLETITEILEISKNIYVLKSKTNNTVFNDNMWIKTYCKEIKSDINADSHHIKFEIFETGVVNPNKL